MTKQDSIKQKWIEIVGEENFSKLLLDENGYSDWNCRKYFPRTLDNKMSSKFKPKSNAKTGSDLIYRPKSLTGIENNNGWFPIIEADRIPENDVWICSDKNNIVHLHLAFTRIPKKYTHYKTIEKPQPLIYSDNTDNHKEIY